MLSKVITHPGQIFVHILEGRDKETADRVWTERETAEKGKRYICLKREKTEREESKS